MMLKAELPDGWDWIIASVANDDLQKCKWIEENCTHMEIAKMYAMQVYKGSAEMTN